MSALNHPYSAFLQNVDKPARYVGGEHFSIEKDWTGLVSTLALAFPDVYDIGMSHQGTKILYSIINKESDLCAERVFCPWLDLEKELRSRKLPLISLETRRPLSDFDVVGFSLQYELTFTNVLTMLELGGIPLRNQDRDLNDPLVIAGGPVATQPEPMTPFIDVFVIGDAEIRLPALMRHYSQMKRAKKLDRTEILIELSKQGGVYCPSLYERKYCEKSDLLAVAGSKYTGVPVKIERSFVADINEFPYPDDSPVPVAEAIFDRMAIEIARGCTEGCRFCQAGMIYRPVREREPQQIVDTMVSALEKGGYDEAALTSLSTADYSCISPLVKGVMEKLRPRKVSLGVSSLRAYGLDEDLLDDISSVKATGLTFAPEAGTQRMRDVVNKNITEKDIFTTCHRVFSRGWNKIKLYFMIGLPTEENEDVLGIAEMGQQARNIAREYHKRHATVTVSVSTHVPKPHTPFQWCAQDSMKLISEKQKQLSLAAKKHGFKLRTHDLRVSHLEGILARGDARVASLVERAWRNGARFDGWDEHLKWDVWCEALDSWEVEVGVSRKIFLRTLPVDSMLPWSHIDVGLADGFLASEYKRALKGRFSPPCGKPVHTKVHHTNLEDAQSDDRKLVCYHCGVACDLTEMRRERLVFLEQMGAEKSLDRPSNNLFHAARARVESGQAPHDFAQGASIRYRVCYSKLMPMSLRGHLDMVRVLPRIFRRAGLSLYYTQGFSPRPVMTFGPALSLGTQSLAEYLDFALTKDHSAAELLSALKSATEEGLEFLELRRLIDSDPAVTKCIDEVGYSVRLEGTETDHNARLRTFLEAKTFPVEVTRKGKKRWIDAKDVVVDANFSLAGKISSIWNGSPEERVLELSVVSSSSKPSLRPNEIVRALLDVALEQSSFVRTYCGSRSTARVLKDPFTELGSTRT